jgi:hypothetical protein
VTATQDTALASSTDGTNAAASQWQTHLRALLLVSGQADVTVQLLVRLAPVMAACACMQCTLLF